MTFCENNDGAGRLSEDICSTFNPSRLYNTTNALSIEFVCERKWILLNVCSVLVGGELLKVWDKIQRVKEYRP